MAIYINQKEEKKNEIFAQHQYFSIERHNRLIDKFSHLLKDAELRYGVFENLGNQEESVSNQEMSYKARLLSENDVIELYNHLEKMIYQCFSEFGKIADIFSEIRHTEIEDKVIDAIDENKNPDEIIYDDSKLVLEEALEEFQKKQKKTN
ncbi:hypothetical protein H5P36_23565 [Bacillus sp. APMAM]|nr:hypothetical protein [Bacillus sp. APMAM]RTZ53453.1 hypothetical protein EKO25_23330 [Bacillus sp. SAJ1]